MEDSKGYCEIQRLCSWDLIFQFFGAKVDKQCQNLGLEKNFRRKKVRILGVKSHNCEEKMRILIKEASILRKTDKISNQGHSPVFRRFPLRYLDIVTLFMSQVLNHVLFCFCHVWSSPVCLLSPSSTTHSSSAPANDHTPWWCHFLPFSLWQTEHQILFWTLNTPECQNVQDQSGNSPRLCFSFQLFLTFTDYLRWVTWWCHCKV